jgi:transcriptional regulator with XRE-family HTH domain
MTNDNSLYLHVGKMIRKARTQRGLTQLDLASRIGLNRTSVSNIEKGRQKLLLHTFYGIAGVLQVDPATLFPASEPNDEKSLKRRIPPGLSPMERGFIEAGWVETDKKRR